MTCLFNYWPKYLLKQLKVTTRYWMNSKC